MYRLPYLLIENKLKAIELEGDALVKEVDLFAEQYEFSNEELQMEATPAVYVEFQSASSITYGDGLQVFRQRINLHVVSITGENLSIVYRRSGGQYFGQSYGHDQLVDKVHAAMQGWASKVSDLPALASFADTDADFQVLNSLDRQQVETSWDGQLCVTVLSYECQLVDVAAVPALSSVLATLDIQYQVA